MEEVWKDYINGYYKVSDQGRILGVKSNIILKQTISGNRRYPMVVICVDGSRKTELVHRIVAKVWVDNPLNKSEVNHKDGNKENILPSNLEWVTASENHIHAHNTKLKTSGEAHTNSKLTETDVAKIRELLKENLGHAYIASKFNVKRATITNINNRRTWK